MQDSQKDYPSQTLRANRAKYTKDNMSDRDDPENQPALTQLPTHRLLSTLSIGIIGGLLATGISVAITVMNASLYQEASRLGDKMSLATAQTITGLGCLGVFIDLLLSFVAGYLVGHMAVVRRKGLLVGAVVGAITALGGFFVHSLPNYPDKLVSATPTSSSTMLMGIVTAILVVLVYSAISALIALWGAWTATRKHPYYQL